MKFTTVLALSIALAAGSAQLHAGDKTTDAEKSSSAEKRNAGDSDVVARFEAQDMDNDGNVDENEMTGDHVWRRNFDTVDVDDNGLLTLAEVTDFEANADPVD
jgi:hypothetical protein